MNLLNHGSLLSVNPGLCSRAETSLHGSQEEERMMSTSVLSSLPIYSPPEIPALKTVLPFFTEACFQTNLQLHFNDLNNSLKQLRTVILVFIASVYSVKAYFEIWFSGFIHSVVIIFVESISTELQRIHLCSQQNHLVVHNLGFLSCNFLD